MAAAVFPRKPDSRSVCRFLESVIRYDCSTPKYFVCEKDRVFWCEWFKHWCRGKEIRPRFGAMGKHGSIAVVERIIRTLKDECTRRILVPQTQRGYHRELASFLEWYNEYRPHMRLCGGTPNEVYFRQRPANLRPRLEPRKRWPRGSL